MVELEFSFCVCVCVCVFEYFINFEFNIYVFTNNDTALVCIFRVHIDKMESSKVIRNNLFTSYV
jgi:hypothetical protein